MMNDMEMTQLEESLKLFFLERTDIHNRILSADELAEYISWLVRQYGNIEYSLYDLPITINNEKQLKLAERILSGRIDPVSFRQLSSSYSLQSEQQFISAKQDISLGRMMRYMPGQWHTSDYFEIYYAPYGKCPVFFQKEKIDLCNGQILIAAPNIVHASPCYADDAILYYFMVRASTFESVFWNQLPKNSLLASFFHRSLSASETTAWLFFDTEKDEQLLSLTHQMNAEFEEAGNYSAQMLNALMTQFFIRILKKYEKSARLPRTDDFYWRQEYSAILIYIQQNYAKAGIRDVAETFHYSTRQISRVVKDCFNLSYAQLILKLRMERASELLRQGDVSVSEISEMIGYADTSSFCRAFLLYYGVSPGKMKKNS